MFPRLVRYEAAPWVRIPRDARFLFRFFFYSFLISATTNFFPPFFSMFHLSSPYVHYFLVGVLTDVVQVLRHVEQEGINLNAPGSKHPDIPTSCIHHPSSYIVHHTSIIDHRSSIIYTNTIINSNEIRTREVKRYLKQ